MAHFDDEDYFDNNDDDDDDDSDDDGVGQIEYIKDIPTISVKRNISKLIMNSPPASVQRAL